MWKLGQNWRKFTGTFAKRIVGLGVCRALPFPIRKMRKNIVFEHFLPCKLQKEPVKQKIFAILYRKNLQARQAPRVVGRLIQDRWTGNDGKPRSRITIVAEHVEFRPELKNKFATKQGEPDNDTSFDEETEPVEMEFAANF